ncbi:IMP dehydrogenase [Candidatus Pacearchaeota archaeon]|nr:IMP dehydrogenase [Candidatus Pacearchaeota archaeon]
MIDILQDAEKKGLGLTFDDVLLVPRLSDVVPVNVDVRTQISENFKMRIPLISSDMDTVTGSDMARAMAMNGGLGFLWKSDIDSQARAVDEVKYTFNTKIKFPITVRVDQTKEDVENILSKYHNRFSSLIAIDSQGIVVGLVTGDRTALAGKKDSVGSFMVKDPVTTKSSVSAKESYYIMKENKVPKLVLVNPNGTLGGLYCFKDVQSIVEGDVEGYNLDNNGQLRVGANVGVNDMERVGRLIEKGCDVLLVGTAHGHSMNVIETVKEIRRKFGNSGNFSLVAGNVATYEGAKELFEAGADAVKVGIGPGSICTTRVVAGVGVPQISAIYAAARAAKECGKYIIADGGIRNSGDVVKAIAAGADAVMMGSVFAGTIESPGEIVTQGGQRFKIYRGMGSIGAMKDQSGSRERYSQTVGKLVPEGVEGRVPFKGSVENILDKYSGGLQSGMGYVGAKDIDELKVRGNFIRITGAGQIEGRPHDIAITKESSLGG